MKVKYLSDLPQGMILRLTGKWNIGYLGPVTAVQQLKNSLCEARQEHIAEHCSIPASLKCRCGSLISFQPNRFPKRTIVSVFNRSW